jgi:DNA-binding NtrC family response regulator
VPEGADVPPESLSLRQVASRAAEDAERKLVQRVLAETKWHRKEAASRLKVSYKALLNKLKRWEAEEGNGAQARLEEAPLAALPMASARSQDHG